MLNQLAHETDILSSFNALILENDAPVIVAISGGSDSTAALFGLKSFVSQNNLGTPIIAVTVDHGLRPESADEATQVAQFCARLGVEHVIKNWRPQETSAGIQEAARMARYTLISEVARAFEAQFVVTGHTQDDQLETIAIRAARGEGRGLAGMAPATLFDRETWFVRPLLDCSRKALRSLLVSQGIGWADDPSNENLSFERVRVRQNSFSNAERDRLMGVQAAAQRSREAESAAGAALIANSEMFAFDPGVNEGRLNLSCIESAGFVPALQTMMGMIAQRSHFASSEIIAQILNYAQREQKGAQYTAHGCLFSKRDKWLVINVESRVNRNESFGYDFLLPSTDFALASALNLRLNRPQLPPLPIKSATR